MDDRQPPQAQYIFLPLATPHQVPPPSATPSKEHLPLLSRTRRLKRWRPGAPQTHFDCVPPVPPSLLPSSSPRRPSSLPAMATSSSIASTSRLVSAPPGPAPLARAFSSTSIASSNGSERKKRSRNLLRDYYGLPATSETGEKKGDPLDIGTFCPGRRREGADVCADSPTSFVPAVYFEKLSGESTVPELLRRENELLGGTWRVLGRCGVGADAAPLCAEIRELDGERQSLVYNHHHELIEASDTIRKVRPAERRPALVSEAATSLGGAYAAHWERS